MYIDTKEAVIIINLIAFLFITGVIGVMLYIFSRGIERKLNQVNNNLIRVIALLRGDAL